MTGVQSPERCRACGRLERDLHLVAHKKVRVAGHVPSIPKAMILSTLAVEARMGWKPVVPPPVVALYNLDQEVHRWTRGGGADVGRHHSPNSRPNVSSSEHPRCSDPQYVRERIETKT